MKWTKPVALSLVMSYAVFKQMGLEAQGKHEEDLFDLSVTIAIACKGAALLVETGDEEGAKKLLTGIVKTIPTVLKESVYKELELSLMLLGITRADCGLT